MKRIIVLCLSAFCLSSGLAQSPTGHWEHFNNEGEQVVITFGKNQEYTITIPNRDLGAIDLIDGVPYPTALKYKINNKVRPATIDIISVNSGQVIKGIIQINEEGTLQMQLNEKPGGSYPEKFDPKAANFYRLQKIDAPPKPENKNSVL